MTLLVRALLWNIGPQSLLYGPCCTVMSVLLQPFANITQMFLMLWLILEIIILQPSEEQEMFTDLFLFF